MTFAEFKRSMNFYLRFLHSFTRIGYSVRKLGWGKDNYDLTGQVWLVTGATGGIGGATVLKALEDGATVIATARNPKKMEELRQSAGKNTDRLIEEMVDLSLVSDTHAFTERLAARPEKIDVLVNNAGLLYREHSTTAEGFETTYAVNILTHHQITESLIENAKFNPDARIIEVTSGGMYNAPANTVMMDQKAKGFSGVAAYATHKRAQMVLTDLNREKYSQENLKFYCMHPGWVDTNAVKHGLPTFRTLLWPFLRNGPQGADTINWIGATAPKEVVDQVWFDRKPRPTHYMAGSRKPIATPEQIVAFLEKDIAKFIPDTAT